MTATGSTGCLVVGAPPGVRVAMMASASLEALNDWLAESGWLGGRIRIGELAFRVVKACGRCVVTTTDQETGERGHEPLRVLARHRNRDNEVLFGVNLIPDDTGPIRVDAPLEVLEML